jgi:hypothetical protein
MKIKVKESSKSRPVWVESDSFIEEGILPRIPPSSYTHPSTHPASMITEDTGRNFVTLGQKNNIHSPGSDNQDLSGLQPKESGKGLSTNDLTAGLKTSYDNAYLHSQTAHAPSNAQPNNISDVNAGLLTGGQETTLHTHPGGGGGLSQQQIEGLI